MKKKDQILLEEAYEKIIGEVSAAWAQKRVDSASRKLPDTGYNKERQYNVSKKIANRLTQDTNSIPVYAGANSTGSIPGLIQLMRMTPDGNTLQVVYTEPQQDTTYTDAQGQQQTEKGYDKQSSTTGSIKYVAPANRGEVAKLILYAGNLSNEEISFPDRGAANQFLQAWKNLAATARTDIQLPTVQQLNIADSRGGYGNNPVNPEQTKQMQKVQQGRTKNFNPAVKTPLPHPKNSPGFTSAETTAWNQANDAQWNR